MTRDAAIRKLTKILGPKVYWRIADGISSPEKRRAYTLRCLNDQFVFAMADRDARDRCEQILKADSTYQALMAERRIAKKQREDSRYHDGESGYKFEVGTRDGLFVTTKAEGDTWEEIFTKLEVQ